MLLPVRLLQGTHGKQKNAVACLLPLAARVACSGSLIGRITTSKEYANIPAGVKKNKTATAPAPASDCLLLRVDWKDHNKRIRSKK
jgi:hypothetical protein